MNQRIDARSKSSTRGYRAPLLAKPPKPTTPFSWRTVAGVLLIGCIAWYAVMWIGTSKSVGVAIIEIPFLLLISAPLFILASRNEQRFDLAGLLATGLALRFAAAYYRFTHAADSATYHNAGIELAKSFRHFQFNVDPKSPVPGTGGIKIIVGVSEVLTNSNAFATFLLFSWLGFLGCYLLYRAFVTAVPDGHHYRYALLIFLWPSLTLWPSSIGKDCWMLFALGLMALGAAKVFVRRPGGYSLLLFGALVIGRRRSRPGALTPASIGKIAGLVVILALGAVLATRAANLLNANDVNSSSITTALNESAARTGQGGSAFSAPNPKNPIGYAEAAVTVLFRPFPGEASGFEGIASSVEALFLLCLVVASRNRLRSIPRLVRSTPYVTHSLAFLLMFVFAFGTIGNFGLLARERIQMLPFLFVLVSVPAVVHTKGPKTRRKEVKPRPEVKRLPRLPLRARAR
jgi:hypothetical protein